MIKIAFYKGSGSSLLLKATNLLIKVWTMGKYSHCELIISDSKSDRWYSISGMGLGIIRRNSNYQYVDSEWDIYSVNTEASDGELEKLLILEMGKKYDWVGIFFCQIFSINMEDPKRWFCSEYCMASLKKALILKSNNSAQSTSPNDLVRIMSDNGILS